MYIWLSTGAQTAKAGGPMRGDGLTKEHCIVECKLIYK